MKIAVMALVAVFVFSAIAQTVSAQMSGKALKKVQKQKDKADGKWYKKKMAEYEKDGWKIAGGSRTLEMALLEHQLKLNEEGNQELSGMVEQCKSINVCKQFALVNAQNTYASRVSAKVTGGIGAQQRGDAEDANTEIDKFIANFKKVVAAEIGGVLTESYSVVKDNGATKKYETVFIVNEEKARSARNRALQQSLQETKIANQELEEISKLVDEFNLDTDN
jgi:hypothetical protein